MTIRESISRIVFTRLVTATCIATQLAAGAVLVKCVATAHPRGDGRHHNEGSRSRLERCSEHGRTTIENH